jgi:hypothetical protein
MNFENQPTVLPNVKPLVTAIMVLVTYHFAGPMIPVEVLGAWSVVIQYAVAVVGGLLAAYPFRDFAGKPLTEEKSEDV